MTLRDLHTGDEQKIAFDPKYNTGGGYVWSPDGQKMVFSVAQFDTIAYDYVGVSIYMWIQGETEATLLVEDYWEFLAPREWTEETRFLLNAVIDEQEPLLRITLEFDLESGELQQIDP